jgi:hypothetical protein
LTKAFRRPACDTGRERLGDCDRRPRCTPVHVSRTERCPVDPTPTTEYALRALRLPPPRQERRRRPGQRPGHGSSGTPTSSRPCDGLACRRGGLRRALGASRTHYCSPGRLLRQPRGLIELGLIVRWRRLTDGGQARTTPRLALRLRLAGTSAQIRRGRR